MSIFRGRLLSRRCSASFLNLDIRLHRLVYYVNVIKYDCCMIESWSVMIMEPDSIVVLHLFSSHNHAVVCGLSMLRYFALC